MTSLIPSVVSLSEFFSSNFPNISWYPYWYLGNPYHYLIGPVVPTILSISNIKDQISNTYIGLIIGSLLLGGVGLYLFLKSWRVGRLQAIVSGVLYTVLPLGVFLLNYQSGLNHIAFGFLPFTLLLFRKFLINESKLLVVFLTFTITIMLLTNVSILLPLVVGFIALFVSIEHKYYSREKIGKTILILFLSLFLSTLWYTPKFWWVTIANPSVGGVPLGKLAWSILQFLLQFLPLILAIFVVKIKKYRPQGYLLFGFLFFTSFLFLSTVRFLNDPDFVIDWISFGLELQFGVSILAGGVLGSLSKKTIGRTVLIACFIIAILLNCYIAKDVIQQFNNGTIEQSNSDYKNRIISTLKTNVGEQERVFLSGSSVFFINSKLNIQQVRGGVDQSSIHPVWADASYQIREGENGDLTYSILKALGTSYVLVHAQNSKEPFRDFKHPDKFDSEYFKLVSEEEGNNLYKVNNSSIGRIADSSILNVQKPNNGADYRSINSYILSFKRPLEVNSALQNQKPNEITIEEDIKQGEVISLAISYDNLWRMVNGKGVIREDPLGNMVIIPEKTGLQKFELVYSRSLSDTVIVLILGILTIVGITKYDKIAPYFKKRLYKLSLGIYEKEE